jgi:hypothetical protein
LDEEDEERFMCARQGDQFMTVFQCELCHYRNIYKRNPQKGRALDPKVFAVFRRATLDSFWARESSTVRATSNYIRRGLEIASEFEFDDVYPARGPLPLDDRVGMREAVILLTRTQDPGRNAVKIQFDTARKIRTGFSTFWHSSIENLNTVVMSKETKKLIATNCKVYGDWYERFMMGVHSRMGDQNEPDTAISIDVLHEMLKRLEVRVILSTDKFERAECIDLGFFLVAGFSGGLRGEEVVKLDLQAMIENAHDAVHNKTPFVPLPLLGRFKGEIGNRHHIIPIVCVSKSGINNKFWFEKIIQLRAEQGRINGWLYQKEDGKREKASFVEPLFVNLLQEIKEETNLIPAKIDIKDKYGIYRSLRRGSNTEAVNQGVDKDDIDLNNRWRKVENAKGRRPTMGMRQHYTEIKLALKALLRYSGAL